MEEKKALFLENLKVIIVTVIVTFVFLQFVQISRVHGTSMEETYHEGNIVLVNKIFYKMGEPKRNDIVIVDYQNVNDDTYIIKRVIGVGGDHIDIKDNVVYVNGKELDENYIKEPMITEDLSIDIPEGKIFVMGDNRNCSLDSRKLGIFDFEDDVIGKVFFKVPFF
ncbi:MAG: signal peptidase I [Faecalibacillus sp.]